MPINMLIQCEPDIWVQYVPIKRGHQNVTTSVWALLFGAGLGIKFWPYKFHHILRIQKMLPHHGKSNSLLILAFFLKDNLDNLQSFGWTIWVWLPVVCRKSFTEDYCNGIFLGYVPHTNCLMVFYNEGSNQVRIVTHETFDKGFNDLPIDLFPSMCQQFQRLNNNQHPPTDTNKLYYIDFNFFDLSFFQQGSCHHSNFPQK